MNHLEQLVAEWYEYNGHFVRRNVKVGPRPTGGYECELDVVAFDPQTRQVVHLEPSSDADSWAKREQRYSKKFEAGRKYIPELFPDIQGDIRQVAVFLFASKANHTTVAGGEIQLVSELITEIKQDLATKSVASKAVPEQFPLLRTIQLTVQN
jgi:hypothetical protein